MSTQKMAITDRQPWDRGERENAASYRAFIIYRDMQGKRSAARVAPILGCSVANANRMGQRYNWRQRANDYDEYMAQVSQKNYEEEVAIAARRQARIAVTMQDVVAEGLKHLDPSTLEARDLARLFDVAVKVERKARKMDEIVPNEQDPKYAITQAPLRAALANPNFVMLIDQLGAHLHDGSRPALATGIDAATGGAGDASELGIDAEWREVDSDAASDSPE